MLERVNQSVFSLLSAPHDLSGGALLFALVLAQWAILVGPALLVFLWVFGGADERRAAVRACLSALLALAGAATISSLYFHPRPFMDGLARNYLQHGSDSSFSSDHATLLFALGWSLAFASPPMLRAAWVIPMALAVVVGWSRVFLGVHYPLDISGAAIVGIVAALCLTSAGGGRATEALTDLGIRVYDWPLSAFRPGRRPR